MNRQQVITVLVISTMAIMIFSVFTLDVAVNAAIVTSSIDSNPSSHQINSVQSTTAYSMSITTSTTDEIIYATVYSSIKNVGLSISSTPALTWNYRGGQNTSSSGAIAVWWAVASTPQTISISVSTSQKTNLIVAAFSVIGADTVSPFDPNLSSLSISSGNSKTAQTSITTTNANDLVIGAAGFASTTTITAGNGFTQIDNTGTSNPAGANEYSISSSTGTYTPKFTVPSNQKWLCIADAFVPASKTVTITSSPQTGTGFITVNGVTQTTPYTASYTPGTVLNISAAQTVSVGGDSRYTFSNWNDSGAQTHDYTVQSENVTIVANYLAQYQITFAQSGLDDTTASTVLTGTLLTVNETDIHYCNFSYSLWVNSGDRLEFTYNTTVESLSTEKRFVLDSTSATSPLTGISGPQTITGNYLTQYLVNFAVNPAEGGTIDVSNGYYTEGSAIPISATPNGDYIFDRWNSTTNNVSFSNAEASSTTMTINGSVTVTANFKMKDVTTLTIATDLDTVDIGNPLTISGTLTSDDTPLSGKPVVISYFNGTDLLEIATVTTEIDGSYQYVWTVPISLPNGQYIISSIFAGDNQYLNSCSADSSGTITVNVLPEYAFGGLMAFVICFAAMFLYIKRNQKFPKNN